MLVRAAWDYDPSKSVTSPAQDIYTVSFFPLANVQGKGAVKLAVKTQAPF
jgi:hypothetical protein